MSKDLTVVPHDYIVHFIKRDDLWAAKLADGSYICVVEKENIPLIRCKECKWVKEHQFANGSQLECHCKYKEYEEDPYCCSYWIVNADDFCSYGERKDDES